MYMYLCSRCITVGLLAEQRLMCVTGIGVLSRKLLFVGTFLLASSSAMDELTYYRTTHCV